MIDLLLSCIPFDPPNSYRLVKSQPPEASFHKDLSTYGKRKGLLENQISVYFPVNVSGSKEVGKEAGCLDALEGLGLTQVKCKSFGQMKVQTLVEKGRSAKEEEN